MPHQARVVCSYFKASLHYRSLWLSSAPPSKASQPSIFLVSCSEMPSPALSYDCIFRAGPHSSARFLGFANGGRSIHAAIGGRSIHASIVSRRSGRCFLPRPLTRPSVGRRRDDLHISSPLAHRHRSGARPDRTGCAHWTG